MPSNVTVRLPSTEELDAYAVEQWEVWVFAYVLTVVSVVMH